LIQQRPLGPHRQHWCVIYVMPNGEVLTQLYLYLLSPVWMNRSCFYSSILLSPSRPFSSFKASFAAARSSFTCSRNHVIQFLRHSTTHQARDKAELKTRRREIICRA